MDTLTIGIIHESNVGAGAEATEYAATIPADEITRRAGCINYGAVSRVTMQLSDFRRYLIDGKFDGIDVVVAAPGLVIVNDCDYDSVTRLEWRQDGSVDLSPLGWEFFPADRFI